MTWIFHNQDLGTHDVLFWMVGRALHLATEFEHKCRCVLSVARLAETDDVDAAFEFARSVEKHLLHPILRELGQRISTDPEDATLLQRARQARNYIAHEAAGLSLHTPTQMLVRLREEVRALAAGDNVASRWWFEITEKRPAPQKIQKDYVDLVERWVFYGSLPA